jgi:hypothetical protein
MYTLSEQQIDFIFNDIGARGVETEDLQYNLLDHVCCIIEQQLEADGDFEQFYQQTIKQFYKNSLSEIEEETTLLLTFKNYYVMRKVMMNSGFASATLMIIGLIFKFMHWPGASFMLVLGIGSASLFYIPLLFTIKVRERKEMKDKLQLAFISTAGILMSLHILFKIMHWPFSMVMAYIAMAILVLLFLPIYVVSGIKNPETKGNTITTAMLVIIGCGLWFTLVVSPIGSRYNAAKATAFYVRNEQVLSSMHHAQDSLIKTNKEASVLYTKCEDLKNYILKNKVGMTTIPSNFDEENILIEDDYISNYFDGETAQEEMAEFRKLLLSYNASVQNTRKYLLDYSMFEDAQSFRNSKVYTCLNELTQLQLLLINQSN